MTAVYFLLGSGLLGLTLGLIYYFFIYDQGSVFEKALRLAEAGNYIDARGIIRSRIEREPDNVKGHYYLARIYQIEGNELQELEHLNEIKRINRFIGEVKPEDVLGRIAQILYQQDRFAEAFENYLALLQFDPQNEHALAHIAFMAAGQESFDVAIRYFQKLTKVAGDVPDYRIAYGVCLAMNKKYSEAIESLRMATNLAPNDQTSMFLLALLSFKHNDPDTSIEMLDKLLNVLQDPPVLYLAHKLATASWYLKKNYAKALSYAEKCLEACIENNWDQEEYDARLSVAYMAIFTGDLEKANEHLMELELRNPADQTVLKVADFRMDLEEQVAKIDEISPRNFDFLAHMQDWVRFRFPEDLIYRISGLKQNQTFDVLGFFTSDGQAKAPKSGDEFDPSELIEKFNNLKEAAFRGACERIIASQGFKVKKELKKTDKDGLDFLAQSVTDKKNLALFRIRKWSNQPISDIFIRDQQNYMNEHKASLGYIVAGARLTPGAETALGNLKKITVINDKDLGRLLKSIL